jgi:hypothetical protein
MDVYVRFAPTGVGYTNIPSVQCFALSLLPLALSLHPLAMSLLPLAQFLLPFRSLLPPPPDVCSPCPSPRSPGPVPAPLGPVTAPPGPVLLLPLTQSTLYPWPSNPAPTGPACLKFIIEDASKNLFKNPHTYVFLLIILFSTAPLLAKINLRRQSLKLLHISMPSYDSV